MYVFIVILLIWGCSDSGEMDMSFESDSSTTPDSEENPPVTNSNWTVPANTVTGIFSPFPLAINPTYRKVNEIDFIKKGSLVAMVSFKDVIKVYPYQYISRFESINDQLNDVNIALTYCPITQSTLCWDRDYKNSSMVLRASGYLHKDNLVAHDAESNTYWSQMRAECIQGKYAGESITTYNTIETKWEIVLEYFPNALVFTNTSIDSNIENRSYKSKQDVEIGDSVFGVIEESQKGTITVFGFTYDMFQESTQIISKNINGKKTIIIGNSDLHFMTSFIDDANVAYTAIQNQYPIIMKDNVGNQWNIFGIAVSGPRQGEQLQSPLCFVAYYWAWQDFYDNIVFQH